jgi:hypothetical protein
MKLKPEFPPFDRLWMPHGGWRWQPPQRSRLPVCWSSSGELGGLEGRSVLDRTGLIATLGMTMAL